MCGVTARPTSRLVSLFTYAVTLLNGRPFLPSKESSSVLSRSLVPTYLDTNTLAVGPPTAKSGRTCAK